MKYVIVCIVALMFSSFTIALAEDAKPAATVSAEVAAARQLIDKYYDATRKAKNITDILPLMSKRNSERAKANPVPPEMQDFAMNAIRNSIPVSYKITSEKADTDRVTFAMSSSDFPPDPMFAMPKGTVANGEFIAVREQGEWKVDKDYWTAKSADGTFKMSFGTNPEDKKEESPHPKADK